MRLKHVIAAALAPEKIPEWFKHEKPPNYSEEAPGFDYSFSCISGTPPEEITFQLAGVSIEPGSRDHALAVARYKTQKAYEGKIGAWHRADFEARYFQWRRYFARMISQ